MNKIVVNSLNIVSKKFNDNILVATKVVAISTVTNSHFSCSVIKKNYEKHSLGIKLPILS